MDNNPRDRPRGEQPNGGRPNGDPKLTTAKIIQQAEAAMEMLDVSADLNAVMAETKPPGKLHLQKIEVQTNIFGIRIEDPKLIVYKYDVSIFTDIGTKRIDFSQKSCSDHVANERRNNCITIFHMKSRDFFFYNPAAVYYYDAQSILYCMDRLVFRDNQNYESIGFPGTDVGLDRHPLIQFGIKECDGDGFQCQLGAVRMMDRDVSHGDRSAMQFVDLATSMIPLSDGNNRFTVFNNGKIFLNNPAAEGIQFKVLNGGKAILGGVTKGVRLIEGPAGRKSASPALVIDSLRAAFHTKMSVSDRVAEIMGREDHYPFTAADCENLEKQLRGVACYTTYGRYRRKIEIYSVSVETAETKRLEADIDGVRMSVTVAEYYQRKYQLNLRLPRLPLIMARERGQVNYYPMETIEVIPMQRVTIPQTTSEQSKETTKMCAVPPLERQAQIWKQAQLLQLVPNRDMQLHNRFLEAAHLHVIPTPLKVNDARQLPSPEIFYASGENAPAVRPDPVGGAWRVPRGKFLRPATCESWAMYGVPGASDKFTIKDLSDFGKMFFAKCQDMGINIRTPSECMIIQPVSGRDMGSLVRDRIRLASEHNCKFLFFVTSDAFTFHNEVVKLEERTSQVVTQDLRIRTAMNVVVNRKIQTLENIINKTNLKLGGHNYTVSIKSATKGYECFPASRLILGIGISHPPPCSDPKEKNGIPSVIGYAANMGKHPTEYFGDFIYQSPHREELLICMPDLLSTVMEAYLGFDKDKEVATKSAPRELIIYRQGVSEGSYALILRHEIPIIRGVLKKYGCGDVKVTYITVQKEHHVRLFKPNIDYRDPVPVQNIAVGTVVDDIITHPNYKEFYLNSHKTLQGSARTPRYTVLVDDSDMAMDQLEMMSHALAFNFQIISSPVSIPAPLYVANTYATRGANLFAARADQDHSSDSFSTDDIAKINRTLCYRRTRLGDVRVNA